MGRFGDVQPLKDIVDIRIGIHPKLKSEKTSESNNDVPLIEGRDIRPDGSLIYKNTRLRVDVPPNMQLKDGDICISSFISKGNTISFAIVEKYMLPLAASRNVIILSPKKNIKEDKLALLHSYLKSKVASEWLKTESSTIEIYIHSLRKLPIPIPDESLNTAVDSLRETISFYTKWKKEAEESLSSLFDYESAKDARMYILSAGQKLRQRVKLAQLADDLNYRIRTRFPYPIAYRWRTIETSKPNLEGYQQVLECAEITFAYLALTSMAVVSKKNFNIGYLETLRQKISERGHGVSMGDWIAIVREINNSRTFRDLQEQIPFYESFNFLRENAEANSAIQDLSDLRNNFSHGRGPKGKENIEKEYSRALDLLKVLLENIEFVSEYPLRYIEETERDSIKGITYYKARDIMGDHPLTPILNHESDIKELEANSLYLVDRSHNLHLLRPFFFRIQCPKCGLWTIYYFDKFDKETRESHLRGMDHSTVVADERFTELFEMFGFI